ncbi:presequence protease, mitochondrial-like isoform X2 [Homarus americanus]|uniref:presequence protease, mitochondrial-like isoform X2 n=1 Tax=Homarus americanus TaxID=6706 RepID=UPI001C4750A6|nr:presequence protease, mitochondrial-like isoform X2 [Homarus americanus]
MTILTILRAATRLRSRVSRRYGQETNRHVWTSTLKRGDAVKNEYQVGEEVSGFLVKEIQDVPELHLTAIRLEHVGTGADYLHVARDDPNNVFCVGFRTTPMDSTGVPHILEHTVLCGSERYPCRDPFFKMLNRSLSTFMNAMTGSDYTVYPFSTQHPVDFRNLLSVYMDAAFRPHLSELDFLQEGWRLEHRDPRDRSSPIVFKGVVFNEMKGVFADSQQLFLQKLQNGLLPSHTYGVVSGGDPLDIPRLTWQRLRDFHSYHYHPSNARFYTYGDQPLVNHLEFINDGYLRHYDKINPETDVPEEPCWSEPRRAHVECGADPMASGDGQTSIAVSYKLVDITNVFETFVLYVLGELLTSGPNAPFYKSLLEPQLGSGFSPSSGFDGHTRNTTFTVGLQGVKDSDVDAVGRIIDETFAKVSTEGFPPERVEAVIHNLELQVKHQTSFFGLGVVLGITPLWNLGGDPIDSLRINQKINRLKKCIEENPKFLQEKVTEYFLENKHKYTQTMSPREGYETKLQEEEELMLSQRLSGLTDDDRTDIWEKGETLACKQEEDDDLSCLPTLKVSDISRAVPPTLVTDIGLSGGVPVQICDQPTNGITYFSAVLDTHDVPDRLRSLVPVLCGVLTRMGAGHLDFRQLDQKLDLVCGGVGACTHLNAHPINAVQYEQGILLSSHCLNQNLMKMLDIWSLILNEVNLIDLQRFTTLVNMIATDQSNSLVYSGHKYAMTAASASTGHVAALTERWSGLTFLKQMKALAKSKDLAQTLERLRELSSLLLSKSKMRVSVNTTPDHRDTTLRNFQTFLNGLSGEPCGYSPLATLPGDFTPHPSKTHQVFPFPVNFASKSFPGVPYCHPDAGALRVLARLMFRFLHREIREKGGAYGGGSATTPGGAFSFYSYRDPHSTQTLETFDAAVEWVLSGEFDQRDVDEAKLGVFQAVDAPESPGAKGRRRFLSHITEEQFADHRRLILDAASQDLVRAARVYLRDAVVEGTCLIGPENENISNDLFWNTVRN